MFGRSVKFWIFRLIQLHWLVVCIAGGSVVLDLSLRTGSLIPQYLMPMYMFAVVGLVFYGNRVIWFFEGVEPPKCNCCGTSCGEK